MNLEAYLVTKEIQLELSDHHGDVTHFKVSPGTMYIPSKGIQLICSREESTIRVEYNHFFEEPETNILGELAMVSERAPKDAVLKIEVNEWALQEIINCYETLTKDLGSAVYHFFNSLPQQK